MNKYLILRSILVSRSRSFLAFLAIAIILYKWTPSHSFFQHYTYKIGFKIRSAFNMSPALSSKIKIYSYDDETTSSLQKKDFYIDEWNSVLNFISNHAPRVIMIDKLFSVTNDPHNKLENALIGLKNSKKPLVTAGLYRENAIKTRKKIDANFHARPISNLQQQGISRRLGADSIALLNEVAASDSMILDLEIASHYYGPSRDLVDAFPNVGNITYEGNGEVKPFIRVAENHVVPHFSLYAGKKIKMVNDKLFVDKMQVGLNSEGNMVGNFSDVEAYYEKIRSLQSLVTLEKDDKKSKFINSDDIILILPSLNSGRSDLQATPIGEIPNGFILTTFINSMVTNNWLTSVDISLPLLLVCCFLGVGFALLARAYTFWIAFPFVLVLFPVISLYLFIWEGVIIPWIYLSFCFASSAGIVFSERIKEKERQTELEAAKRKEVSDAFSNYLSQDAIDEVNDHPEKLELGSTKRSMTVLFSDVRSFAIILNELNPEDLSSYMKQYLNPLTDIVLERKGVLDKYIGDAIMAFWGAPLYNQDHPNLAAESAIKMISILEVINKEYMKQGLPAIDLGIGINTGYMTVGNMGSKQRFCYTVIGDEVKFGAKLEGLTKYYGVKILISELTKEHLAPEHYTRDLDTIIVKGEKESGTIFELMQPDFLSSHDEILEFIDFFSTARMFYLGQKWEKARKYFYKCLEKKINDGPSLLYLERINEVENQAVKKDWDGVWRSLSK